MNLRIRTILAVAALVLVAVAVFYGLTFKAVLDSSTVVEERAAEVNAQRLSSFIKKSVNDLEQLTIRYAQLDETYRYAKERNPEYLANTLTAAVFAKETLDNVVIFDAQGNSIYEAIYNPQIRDTVTGAQSLVTYVRDVEVTQAKNFITHPADAQSGISGLIMLPEGPMLISAQPILPTSGAGDIRGTLVMGRYLGAQEMRNLTDVLQAPVSYMSLENNPAVPEDFQQANASIGALETSFVRTDQDATFVYIALSDIIDRRAMLMRVDMPHDLYSLVSETQHPLSIIFIIGGGLTAVAVAALVFGVVFWPLKNTQRTLQTIRQKKTLNIRLPIRGKDEFASLVSEVNNLLGDLEQANQDALQGRNAQQRLQQMQLVRQVTGVLGGVLNLEQIVRTAVAEIGDRFGYYYVGVFLVDDAHLTAILRAGTGNVVPVGYQLTVGGSSTVGRAIARLQVQVAEVGSRKDQISFTRLPMARSEIAIPIRYQNEALGAIAIQSTQADTFKNPEDQEILQYLADFIGSVLVTARLMENLQSNYKNLEAQYQQVLTERWDEELRLKNDLNYTFQIRSDGRNKEQVHQLQVPLALNDVKIGWVELDTERPNWPAEDRAMLDAILAQMMRALENARLLERSRRRATQERLVAEVIRAARSSTDVGTILHTSVLELGRLLRASKAEIRIQPDITAIKPDQPVAPKVQPFVTPTVDQAGDSDEMREVTA